jgi:hypothetical protein
MRLLDTSTITLHEFLDANVPDYAILSHRWNLEEVSFQDLQSGKGIRMTGYAKVSSCCAQAKKDGWRYVWIDSCCIDKSSSAELSEAINSMYKWYEKAQICYAYLSDVPGSEMDHDRIGSAFRLSQWLRRGWTLQERLAPKL